MNDMDQYISKATVKAEIEKKLQDLIVCKRDTSFIEHRVVLSAKIDMCKEILSFLEGIEMKEVNFEKEFDKCCENYTFDDECEVYTAKHFFELGLKAQGRK